MGKKQLEELIASLTEMAQYLEECDEELAWEVSAKNRIDARVYAMPGRIREIRAMAQALLREA